MRLHVAHEIFRFLISPAYESVKRDPVLRDKVQVYFAGGVSEYWQLRLFSLQNKQGEPSSHLCLLCRHCSQACRESVKPPSWIQGDALEWRASVFCAGFEVDWSNRHSGTEDTWAVAVPAGMLPGGSPSWIACTQNSGRRMVVVVDQVAVGRAALHS